MRQIMSEEELVFLYPQHEKSGMTKFANICELLYESSEKTANASSISDEKTPVESINNNYQEDFIRAVFHTDSPFAGTALKIPEILSVFSLLLKFTYEWGKLVSPGWQIREKKEVEEDLDSDTLPALMLQFEVSLFSMPYFVVTFLFSLLTANLR